MDKGIRFKRSKVSAKPVKGGMEITINSDDTIALIASMNSMLKQFRVISSVREVTGK